MHYLHRTLILAFFILFFQKKFVVQACICRLLHIFLSYSYAQYLSLKNVPFFYSRQLQLKWVLAYYCNHLPKHVSLSIPWQWNDWKIIQMKIENSVWNFEIYLTAMWFISLHLTCAPPPHHHSTCLCPRCTYFRKRQRSWRSLPGRTPSTGRRLKRMARSGGSRMSPMPGAQTTPQPQRLRLQDNAARQLWQPYGSRRAIRWSYGMSSLCLWYWYMCVHIYHIFLHIHVLREYHYIILVLFIKKYTKTEILVYANLGG